LIPIIFTISFYIIYSRLYDHEICNTREVVGLTSLFYSFMLWYQKIFHPVYFLLICAFIVIYIEWRNNGGSLAARVLTLITAWVIGFVIYNMHSVFYPSASEQWIEDVFAAIGAATAILITLVLWKIKGFGVEWIGNIVGTIAVLVPFAIISPFWNISGHVTFTTAPVVYIVALERRWIWLFIIPLVMIINRPVVGAHTVAQSIAGFFLGMLALVGYLYIKRKRESK